MRHTTIGATLTSDGEITHGPGHVAIGDGDLAMMFMLDQYDELPIAATLALELLRAASDCLISDEPSTREQARQRLVEVGGLCSVLLDRLDDADRETAVGVVS